MDGEDGAGKSKQTVKAGLDKEEGRRKREEHAINIRKQKRAEQLAKHRRATESVHAEDGSIVAAAPGAAAGGAAPVAEVAGPRASPLEIPRYTSMILSDSLEAITEATTCFRKLLSIEKEPPIDAVVAAGVVPRLVQLLQVSDPHPRLQFEAAWALTNIASGTSEHTKVVVHFGAVPEFKRLLDSPAEDVREQAVWALGNIAGDSATLRDLVLECGALEPVLRYLVPTAKVTYIRNATWTLSNFCRGKPPPKFPAVAPGLPRLAALLYSSDADTLQDALWALSYLSDGDEERLGAVLEAGVVGRVVELMTHTNPNVVVPALRTIGNVVTGDDLQTQTAIEAGVLGPLAEMLKTGRRPIRKEACWAISNVMAGTPLQIEAALNANVVPLLAAILSRNSAGDLATQKEAAWALSNATSGGTPPQVARMVSQGALAAFAFALQIGDAKVQRVAVEGIENILAKSPAAAEGAAARGVTCPYKPEMERADIPALLAALADAAHSGVLPRAAVETGKKAGEVLDAHWAGYGAVADAEGDEYDEDEDDDYGDHSGGAGAGGYYDPAAVGFAAAGPPALGAGHAGQVAGAAAPAAIPGQAAGAPPPGGGFGFGLPAAGWPPGGGAASWGFGGSYNGQ